MSDDGGGVSVTALLTTDGERWRRVELTPAGGDTYRASFPLPDGPSQVSAIVEAVDSSGNVTVETAKGALEVRQLALPVTVRP